MKYKFKCPGCGKEYDIPEEYNHQMLSCPSCGEESIIDFDEKQIKSLKLILIIVLAIFGVLLIGGMITVVSIKNSKKIELTELQKFKTQADEIYRSYYEYTPPGTPDEEVKRLENFIDDTERFLAKWEKKRSTEEYRCVVHLHKAAVVQLKYKKENMRYRPIIRY